MEYFLESKDTHKIEVIEDDSDLATLQHNVKGILCVPEDIMNKSQPNVLTPQTYDFAKWVRRNKQDICIDVAKSEGIKGLHSHEFWIPVAILASDISIQIFLGLVSSYIYDRIKGALKHDKTSIHLQAYYKETPEGVIKKFSYNGSIEGFEKITKKFNVNKFLD